jgi:hypothetical protein
MLWLFVVVIPLTLVLLLVIVETPSAQQQHKPRRVSPKAYRLGRWIGKHLP